MFRTIATVLASGVTVLGTSGVLAQVAEPVAGSGQSATGNVPSDRGQVEDIVVTAQRRGENLQNVPIAITAISAATLEQAQITRTDDLATVTPGLVFRRSVAAAIPFLRGVGAPGGGAGDEASIALYVDDVYMPILAGNLFALNNVERIEVLKGPQGTLFGRNATGGLIQIITKTPSEAAHADVSLGYASYGTVQGDLYATGGITQDLAADVSLHYSRQARGYGRNLVTGNPANREKEFAARTKWLWTPSDDTRITLALDYNHNKTDIGPTAQPLPGTLAVLGTPFRGSWYDTQQSFDQVQRATQGGVSLKIIQDMSWAQLLSVTSYRKTKVFYHYDQDQVPSNIVDINLYERARSFSQELQLSSLPEDSIKWAVGLFYFDGTDGYRPYLGISGSAFAALGQQRRQTGVDTTSYSAYGQATIPIFTNTNVTIGGRFTRDKKRLSGFYYSTALQAVLAPGVVDVSASFKKPTWRLALDHHFSENMMGYISYNRGFKSGGFDPRAITNPAFRPEVLDAYQAGIKTELFDRRVRINAEGFYYDYRNIQLTATQGSVSNIYNAAGAEIYGLDIDTTVIPVENLTLTASGEYLTGKYTNFPNAVFNRSRPTGGNATGTGVATGFRTIRTPKYTFTLGSNYEIHSSIGALNLGVTYSYTASFFWEPDHKITERPLNMLNAQIGWSSNNEHWGIRLWGRNLLDEEYSVYSSAGSFGDIYHPGSPRTLGVSFEAHF